MQRLFHTPASNLEHAFAVSQMHCCKAESQGAHHQYLHGMDSLHIDASALQVHQSVIDNFNFDFFPHSPAAEQLLMTSVHPNGAPCERKG